ncbi:MAG: metallophosphoesterase [Polyangiaceae bacterium]
MRTRSTTLKTMTWLRARLDRTRGRAPLKESLLVLSDVHLGSDINDLTPHGARRSAEVDRDLVGLLDHYRRTPAEGRRWRLVVAGDFIDFIGMSVAPDGLSLQTPLTEEERAHGLGNAEDHSREKLRRVAQRHAEVFAALAAFVEAGNALTFVHGNHDLELYWGSVRAELLEILLAHRTTAISRRDFAARVDHNPWFYYVAGAVYVEHGHQYDPFCATDHPMMPLAAGDRQRLSFGFCEVLLRHVVRPTRGLPEHGHEELGVVDYVRLGVRMGLVGMTQLFWRYVRAVAQLFRLWRQHWSASARTLRRQHWGALVRFARRHRIRLRHVRAARVLQTPPITRTVRGVMASLLVDRLALLFVAGTALLILALLRLPGAAFWIGAAAVLGLSMVAYRYIANQRTVDADDRLRERASKLVRLFPSRFVVMGHTHTPRLVKLAHGESTYVNVGGWSEEEGASPAPRTHLVVHPRRRGVTGALLRWCASNGPVAFETR